MIQNTFACPACHSALQKEIRFGDRDEIIVECPRCGRFAISRELFEDYLENDKDGFYAQNMTSFLSLHKGDKLRPLLTKNTCPCPDGYQNYAQFRMHYLNRQYDR